MKFEKYDKMVKTLALKGVGENTFNSFDINKFSEYQTLLRDNFSEFKQEQENNLRVPFTENDLIAMHLNIGHMEGYKKYFKKELDTLDGEYKKFINDSNLLLYKQFQNEKIRYVDKILSFISKGLKAISDGSNMFSQIGKKSEIQIMSANAKKYKHDYFRWERTPDARERLYEALIKEKFLDPNTKYDVFKKAFVCKHEGIPKNVIHLSIKWIDRNVNNSYSKKSLVYFIDELINNKIIVNPLTSNRKNKIISFLFSHDGNTILTRLSQDKEKREPKRDSDIDSIIMSLNNY